MAPPRDPETAHANQWETDSVVSVAPSVRPSNSLPTVQHFASQHQGPLSQAWPALPSSKTPQLPLNQENLPPRISQHHAWPAKVDQPQRSSSLPSIERPQLPPNQATLATPPHLRVTPPSQHGLNRAISSGHPTPRTPNRPNGLATTPTRQSHRERPHQSHRNGYNPSSARQPNRVAVPRGAKAFASPAGLVTTRMAIQREEQAARHAEMQRLRSTPESIEQFAVTGYYLWPKGPGPMKLFDPALSTFDKLRESLRVHIDWDPKMKCLRINCIAEQSVAEQNIASAIDGIKLRYLDAQAQTASATTTYVLVPPTSEAIRSNVRGYNIVEREPKKVITSIRLAGERLTPAALSEWEVTRRQMSEESFKLFRTQIFKNISALEDLRSWMRMRVHFGHVNLSEYPQTFLQGTYSFGKFAEMMKRNRVIAGGEFDRKMDAEIAMNIIQRFVGRKDDFAPRNSKTPSLEEVINNPRHTEIVFVSTAENRAKLRLEAEIETVQTGAMGKYQIGHTRLFKNDTKNTRATLTTLDIQSKFDWTVEIIQDSEINQVPQVLRKLIAASLDNRSDELVDPVGLPYPAIALRAPTEFTVDNVVMRSVFQYQWTTTSNIVEISIYREWAGVDTRSAPKMQASISMFGAEWDTQLRPINNTDLARNWDKQLYDFFGKDEAGKRSGFKGLIAETREVQRLLGDAAMEVAVKRKLAEEKYKHEEDEDIESQIREFEAMELNEEELLQRQIREIHEADEAEEEVRREHNKSERANATATVYAPLSMGHSFVSGFDDTPNPDGSLI